MRDTIFLLLAWELFCLSAWLRKAAFWEGLAQFSSYDVDDLLYIGEINCIRCSVIKLLQPHHQATKNVGIRIRPYLSLSFAVENRSVLILQRLWNLLSHARQNHSTWTVGIDQMTCWAYPNPTNPIQISLTLPTLNSAIVRRRWSISVASRTINIIFSSFKKAELGSIVLAGGETKLVGQFDQIQARSSITKYQLYCVDTPPISHSIWMCMSSVIIALDNRSSKIPPVFRIT